MRDENEHHQSMQSVDEVAEDSVAWVNQQGSGENESMMSKSDDYMVMSIKKKKNVTELKFPGARVQVEVSGKKSELRYHVGDCESVWTNRSFHSQYAFATVVTLCKVSVV